MNTRTKQTGVIQEYFMLIGAAAGLTLLVAACAYSYHLGKANIQTKWDSDTAAKIILNDKAKQAQVTYVANLVRDSLDKQAEIAKLSNDIKVNGLTNETSKFCPGAPVGSVVITPSRLRDLKALYK